MANRIEQINTLPAVLPEPIDGKIASERVQSLPVKFPAAELSVQQQEIIARLNNNLRAVKEDLLLLKVGTFLTLSDYKGLIVVSDAELITLNGLLGGNVLARLTALETPTPP